MCRMCLVDVGRPMIDRATGEAVKEADGSPKIQFGPKLETSCTTPISEGMVVVTESQKVVVARKEMLEFILTSHPLDCPVCDKGGECPLQNLTMKYGPGQSRFIFDEKMHLGKHVPLGELIMLDRERCIECARCVRFQHEVVDDPVIDFYNRGRALEIRTYSEPGFDSYFSGNTSDICPVGALTTADFRFGARPWEMKASASICTQCPVGCNIDFNVRRDAKTGGHIAVKRVMPRQNEAVNEIWICDKGRFGYHFAQDPERVVVPMVRKAGKLVQVSLDEALDAAAAKMKAAGVVALAGGRLSTEDLYNIKALADGQNGKAYLHTYMGGGDLVSTYGLSEGSNLGTLGKGDVILVAASDLHEEAPIWWLRIKQAVKRGAALIVANPRKTRLEKYATRVVRYAYGEEGMAISAFSPENLDKAGDEIRAAAELFNQAANAVIFYGSEGLGLAGSQELAWACANLLLSTKHFGRPNNGLVPVWHAANLQAGWEIGLRPAKDLAAEFAGAGAAYIVGADPAGDDPELKEALKKSGFVVVQELYLTETARMADVVLPAASMIEREGSFVSGERRLQRYYPAVQHQDAVKPDFMLTALLGKRLGLDIEGRSANLVLQHIAGEIASFAGMTYQKLAEVTEQWPVVGGSDLYYGGTSYNNKQGLGMHLSLAVGNESANDQHSHTPLDLPKGALMLAPITVLYDRGQTLVPSHLLDQRRTKPQITLHPDTAERFGLTGQERVELQVRDEVLNVALKLDDSMPKDVILLPRSLNVAINGPMAARIRMIAEKDSVTGEGIS